MLFYSEKVVTSAVKVDGAELISNNVENTCDQGYGLEIVSRHLIIHTFSIICMERLRKIAKIPGEVISHALILPNLNKFKKN